MSEQLDPFYISKIQVIYFQDEPKKGCMYNSLQCKGDFRYFNGSNDELEKYVIDAMKISNTTNSLKIVTVYGYDNVSCYKEHLNILSENLDYELNDEDPYHDEESECYSFYFDHRTKDCYEKRQEKQTSEIEEEKSSSGETR